MKRLASFLLLLVAACGGAANQSPGNAVNEPGDGHDHYHSHAGQTISLGSQKLGDVEAAAFLKDKLQRGGTTQFEIQLSDSGLSTADLVVEIVDKSGTRVTALGLHTMAQPGRFGAHAGLGADAPRDLKLRVTLKSSSTQSAEYAIPE